MLFSFEGFLWRQLYLQVIVHVNLASHADVLRGSSRVPGLAEVTKKLGLN